MRKQKQYALAGILIMMVTTLSLSGCTNTIDKTKFLGTWTTPGGEGSMTFTNDNKVTVTGQLGDISLSGIYTWTLADGKITFTSDSGGPLGVTFDYSFPSANQVIFTNSNGVSVTLNKA